MDYPETIAQVVRVTRGDTVLVRCTAPQLASMVAIYVVLCGVRCKKRASSDIVDWVEAHADADRLNLVSFDWVRDSYGRLLADLADISTGERLTDYLLNLGVAEEYPHHYADVVEAMIRAQEPE